MHIEDYAVIGDCHTAALVGRNGSIDWLCMPRFDSDACFAALLGTPEHGRWLIAPVMNGKKSAPHRVTRRYRGDSLILETLFTTPTGSVRLIDFMVMGVDDRSMVRIVEGVSGHVAMETELVIRFDFGSIVPWMQTLEEDHVAIAGPDALCYRTPVEAIGARAESIDERGDEGDACDQEPRRRARQMLLCR